MKRACLKSTILGLGLSAVAGLMMSTMVWAQDAGNSNANPAPGLPQVAVDPPVGPVIAEPVPADGAGVPGPDLPPSDSPAVSLCSSDCGSPSVSLTGTGDLASGANFLGSHGEFLHGPQNEGNATWVRSDASEAVPAPAAQLAATCTGLAVGTPCGSHPKVTQ